MPTALPERLCVTCKKILKGRTDKKFCDDYCRNNFNNQLKAESNNIQRNINNVLGKNRRILESIISEGEEIGKSKKEKLIEKGFLFKYFTHNFKNKKGDLYFFCYDYGYLPLENDWYLIVKKEDD